MIKFIKMESLGNDFVVLQNLPFKLEPHHVRAIADRRKGIGCDQVLLLDQLPSTLQLKIWNQDGSHAKMCGNGIRCILWLHTTPEKPEAFLMCEGQSFHGKRTGPQEIEVFCPAPHISPPIDLKTWGLPPGIPASLGNPHLVIFLQTFEGVDINALGQQLEHHPTFPQGTNVHFVVICDGKITMKTWERGVGRTMACGSGACVVGSLVCHKKQEAVWVYMDGGAAQIRYHPGVPDQVSHQGPVQFVFEGFWGHC